MQLLRQPFTVLPRIMPGYRYNRMIRQPAHPISVRRFILVILNKGGKLRYVPLHPQTAGCLNAYLQASGHEAQRDSPLFRPMINNRVGHTETALTVDGVYAIVTGYGQQVGIAAERFAPHALRATAATNALDHQADIAKVQAWLGHASIASTRVYDRRTTRPEDSPTFKVSY